MRNLALQLRRDDVRDAELMEWLLDRRLTATKRLVDRLWPDVERVAAALLAHGDLSGFEVKALLG